MHSRFHQAEYGSGYHPKIVRYNLCWAFQVPLLKNVHSEVAGSDTWPSTYDKSLMNSEIISELMNHGGTSEKSWKDIVSFRSVHDSAVIPCLYQPCRNCRNWPGFPVIHYHVPSHLVYDHSLPFGVAAIQSFTRNLKPIKTSHTSHPNLPRTPELLKNLFPPGIGWIISMELDFKVWQEKDRKGWMSLYLFTCPFQPPQTVSFPASLRFFRCSKVTGKLL